MTQESRGIKCGKCKEYHPTVADVRKCQGVQTVAEQFRAQSKKEPEQPVIKSEDVVPGRYALEKDGPGSELTFYQIDKPGKDSRWYGRVFVNRLVGAPGDFARYPVRGSAAGNVIRRVMEDPKEAMIRFGKESRYCGACGSPLSNTESRKAGIGPVCARKRGW